MKPIITEGTQLLSPKAHNTDPIKQEINLESSFLREMSLLRL